jgi:hypothetical protein
METPNQQNALHTPSWSSLLVLVAPILFVFSPWWGRGMALAIKGGNKDCQRWCACVFPKGPDRNQCIADAKKGKGLCYSDCGHFGQPNDPTASQNLCGGPDYATTVCCLDAPNAAFQCSYDAFNTQGHCINAIRDCSALSNCSGNGYCDLASGGCNCVGDWIGNDCGTFNGPPVSCSTDADCSGDTPICVSGTCRVSSPLPCLNDFDYCSGQGLCVNGACECVPHYSGFQGDCSDFTLEDRPACP